jgi:hypothetical protein
VENYGGWVLDVAEDDLWYEVQVFDPKSVLYPTHFVTVGKRHNIKFGDYLSWDSTNTPVVLWKVAIDSPIKDCPMFEMTKAIPEMWVDEKLDLYDGNELVGNLDKLLGNRKDA